MNHFFRAALIGNCRVFLLEILKAHLYCKLQWHHFIRRRQGDMEISQSVMLLIILTGNRRNRTQHIIKHTRMKSSSKMQIHILEAMSVSYIKRGRIETRFPIIINRIFQGTIHTVQRSSDIQPVIFRDVPYIPGLKIHITIITGAGTHISSFRLLPFPFTNNGKHLLIIPSSHRAQSRGILNSLLHYCRFLHLGQYIYFGSIHDSRVILIFHYHSAVQCTVLLCIYSRQRQQAHKCYNCYFLHNL